MMDRTRARYLAPAALIVTILGAFLLVRQQTSSHPRSAGAPRTVSRGPHGRAAHGKFYVVRAGDSLTRIAAKTGVTIVTIETLNHMTDPNSLQAGKQLRLQP